MPKSWLFSKLEVVFCAFLAENNFVNALILFIRVRKMELMDEGRLAQQDCYGAGIG